MFRTLYSRLAAVLMGVFVAVGGLMIVATQTMLERDRLLVLATDLVIGAVAFSLLAALVVFHFLTRRLRTLAEAVDAFRTSGFAQPVRIDEPGAAGDEIDRLACAFAEISERIIDQLDALAKVDAHRRELLANVSHDLRTPLASMQGYLETLLLQEDKLTQDERRSYLLIAARHCERLGLLVRDLFDLTRLEAHEIRARPEAFSIAELAQDVAQKFELRAAHARQQLVTDIDAATPAIVADIGMIERVLENLIENAMRYTPPGGTVALGVGPDPGGVIVTVSDTGQGIAAEELASIFDRYYRIDRGERGDTGNAGLGLAITRRIVELHGGTIAVESGAGSGTRFVVTLPLGRAAQ